MILDNETWKVILSALGIVLGATFSAFQLRNSTSKQRSTLKTDLEILKLLDSGNEYYQQIQSQINEQIRRTYIEQNGFGKFKIYNWYDFVFGVVTMLIFSTWTLFLLKDGSYWWAILTGIIAVIGLFGIMNGFDQKLYKELSEDTSEDIGVLNNDIK